MGETDTEQKAVKKIVMANTRQTCRSRGLNKAGIDRYVAGLNPVPAVPVERKTVYVLARLHQKRKKLKVASYCRVSSIMDSQQISIESQRRHYEDCITSNPDWEFAGTYLEEGVTGTKAEIRPELMRLMDDCRAGKIDLILTKSISRFARNTADCLELVRELTAIGTGIRFEKENLQTTSMDSEFMLSVLACFAEYESHSISENIKWSIRKRFENGTYRQSLAPYGYSRDGNNLVVNDAEAVVVRFIFKRALTGKGSKLIADELNNLQIPSPCNQSWSQNTIRLILKNPVYSGSVLFQKTFVDESFRQRKNVGELDRFLIEGHHEAIVERISAEKASNIHKAPPRSKPGRYGFTGRLICAECGSVMHRDCCNKARPTWICHRHKTQSGLCTMKPVSESDLKAAFINCLNKLSWSKMPDKYNELSAKYDAGQNEQKLVEIDAAIDSNRQEMNRLMARLMQNHQPKERRRIMLLQNKQKELLAERQHILSGTKADVPLKKLKQFINSWQITNDISSFPEGLFGSLVLNCTVNARKSVVFHFGCGISLKETLEMSDEECN